jgi:hypothetical protein
MANRFGSLLGGNNKDDEQNNRFPSLVQAPSPVPVPSNPPTLPQAPQPSWRDQILHGDINGLLGGNNPQSTLNQIKVGDIRGLGNQLGIGISQGLSKIGSAKEDINTANLLSHNTLPYMANIGNQQLAQQQQHQDYLKANPVNSFPAMIGEQIPQIPLWMAGEGAIGALGKGLSKLSPSLASMAERVGSKLPSFVKGGLTDAATYGSVVAPTQNYQQGGGWQGLIQSEKQLPLIALGGIGVRGLGELAGGLHGADYRNFNEATKLPPELNINPLQDIQNAYKTPINLRDAQAQNLNRTFADTTNNLGQTGPTLPRQGMSGNELLQQNRLDAQRAFSRPPISENITPQGTLPEQPGRLTWSNRDNIPSAGQLPIRSITKDNLGQLPGGLPKAEIPTSKLGQSPLEPRIAQQPQANLPKSNLPINQGNTVGATPDIPAGLKERGVSANIRTDANRPDALRDSFSTDPLVYKQLGNKETLAKAQDIFDQGFDTARKQVDELLMKGKPEAAPLTKMLADKLTNEGDIVGARDLLSNAATKATEAGQFGQAFRILREADPETFLMTFDKQLGKLNKEGLDAYGKNWKTVDLTPDELSMVSKIERGNQASYDSAFEQIQKRIANELPSTAWEKVNAWRHISMLLNPKTQIRNVVGNGIMMGMRRNAKQVSAVLQKVLPVEERTQVFKIKGEYQQAATDYFEANKKDLLGGANKYNESVSLNMPNKRVFQNNVLESTRKLTYKTLEMGDTPFYKNAYINRLASYAQAKGIKDFSKLGQEAFDTAKLEAEQATYKDASSIADFINKHKRIDKNSNFGTKIKAGLVEAALPFTKTPVNIIKRGMQYSPIGLVNGLAGIKSSKGAAVAIDEMAKGLTGTGILGLGYLLASKGILTGKASSDPDLRAYDTNTGNSPFSIMGKFTYDWAQPFSVPLSVGVEIYNATKDNPKDTAKMNSVIANNDTSKLQQMALTAANGIMEGLNASGDTVFNMSIMKGIKTLLGSGTKGFMEGLAQLPQNYASQFIPTLSSQIAGTIDPLVRSAYVPGNLPASFKNTLISKIPIASKTLQPKQTPYGENMKKIENPLGRAFSQFLSPGIIAKDQGNVSPKINTELRRLNESGLVNQFPTMVPNYIEKTQTHPKISLSPVETTQYQQRVGQLTLTAFDKLMNQGKYNNAHQTKLKSPDELRADLLATAISDSKATAKKEILKSKGLK